MRSDLKARGPRRRLDSVSLAALTLSLALCATTARAQTALVTGLGGPAGFGTNSLAGNDDGSTGAISLTPAASAGLCFFGRMHTQMFVNNNGNITFAGAVGTFTPSPFPIASQPMIAPFWADVDTRGTGTGIPPENLVYYDVRAGQITVTWYRVGYYSGHVDLRNNFQLQIRNITDAMNYDIEFRYQALAWTTGDASGGSAGLGGTPGQAGFDAGNLMNFVTLPGSRTMSILDLVRTSNVNPPQAGLWRFQIRNCRVPNCGDMVIDPGEECDDGNRTNGDGCNATCLRELANGAMCTSGALCRSGICADGVCCNAACTGQCEACNLPSTAGTCSPVTGAGSGPCALRCNGTNRTACVAPTGSMCTSTNCSVGTCAADGTCGNLMTGCQAPMSICDTASNMCVGCRTSADCSGATPICDSTTRSCRACDSMSATDCTGATPACAVTGANAGRCVRCTSTNRAACTGATPLCSDTTNQCFGCNTNADCSGATPICEPTTRLCRACDSMSATDCTGANPACATSGTNAGRCVRCTATNRTACTGTTPLCNDTTNQCIGCNTNADCAGATPICEPSTRLCRACNSMDCTGAAAACATSGTNAGRCVQCTTANAAACAGATPNCDDSRGVCVGCVTDANCSGATPVCDATTRACRACTASDCTGERPVCATSGTSAGRCVECAEGSAERCMAPSVCNPTTNQCVGCNANADCRDSSRPICNPMTRTCQPCDPMSATDCTGATPVCATTGTNMGRCVSCTMGSMGACMSGQVCDPANNQCVACLGDADCGTGQRCEPGATSDQNRCVMAVSDAGTPDASNKSDAGDVDASGMDAGGKMDASVTDAGAKPGKDASADASMNVSDADTKNHDAGMDGGSGSNSLAGDGCSCSAPGASHTNDRGAVLLALAALGAVIGRRRARR
jgi:hypothetical protein